MTPGVGALERSEDPLHRIGQYQHHQSDAQLRIVEVLTRAGLSAELVDELLCSVEAGVLAGVQCIAVELAYGPSDRGEAYRDAWTDGAQRIAAYLVECADRAYEQRGQTASALAAIAYWRQRQAEQAAQGVEDQGEGEVGGRG